MTIPKKLIIIAVVVLLAAYGLIAYLLNRPSARLAAETAVSPSPVSEEEAVEEAVETATYVEYTKDNLDRAASKRRVLFFYASWCPTCRPADADFNTNIDTLPSDIAIIRVNYNDPETSPEEQVLAQQYNVTYQHTFVQISPQGKEIARWTGGQLEELSELIR